MAATGRSDGKEGGKRQSGERNGAISWTGDGRGKTGRQTRRETERGKPERGEELGAERDGAAKADRVGKRREAKTEANIQNIATESV